MTTEEALKILDNVCAGFHGTRADHVAMQQAMQVVTSAAKPEPDVKEDEQPDGNK